MGIYQPIDWDNGRVGCKYIASFLGIYLNAITISLSRELHAYEHTIVGVEQGAQGTDGGFGGEFAYLLHH